MRSYKAILPAVWIAFTALSQAIAGEAVNGTFTQPSDGFHREPAIGPSRLTIEDGRFALTFKEREAVGSVRATHDLLLLDLDDPQFFSRDGHTVATRFCITRHGNNVLLVDLESLAAFCNSINSHNRLGPAGTGAIVLARPATDREKQEIDQLANPLIRPLILGEDVSGKITRLDNAIVEGVVPGTRFGTIQGYLGTLSLGRVHGVYPGMALHYSQESGGIYGIAWVTAVTDKESTLLVEQIEKAMGPPKEGTALSVKVP